MEPSLEASLDRKAKPDMARPMDDNSLTLRVTFQHWPSLSRIVIPAKAGMTACGEKRSPLFQPSVKKYKNRPLARTSLA